MVLFPLVLFSETVLLALANKVCDGLGFFSQLIALLIWAFWAF